MRITFVLPTFNMSGGTRVVAIYAKALLLKGHDVVLISPPARRVPLIKKIKSFMRGKGWPSNVMNPDSHIDDLGLDYRVLDQWRAPADVDVPDGDIVIATWWLTAEWVNALSTSKGIKLYLIQGHEIYIDPVRGGNTYWLPMHKIVVSKWLQDVMRVVYRDNHCSLIENGVDHKQFNAPARSKRDKITVGFVYSPLDLKHCDLAINAVIEAKKIIPELRVIAFGTYRYPESLPACVDYHFNPHQGKLKEYYAACDAWLFTSRSEGFGLPILEAMSCRTPVLATRAGAAPELVSSETGRLLPDSIEAFADAIVEFANMDASSWQIISNNAYTKALSHSWDNASKKFEKVLTEIGTKK